MPKISRILFKSPLLNIGAFDCHPSHPFFNNTGPIDGYLIVFPRTCVCITHTGRRPVVADPNVAMFYNAGQTYHRGKLSERGDRCDWFGFGSRSIVEAVRPYDPAVDERWHKPFIFTHGPTDPDCYLQQRLLIQYIEQTAWPDCLYVEEQALAILHRIVAHTYQVRKRPLPTTPSKTKYFHAEIVRAVKEILATRFKEGLSLHHIAAEVYTSPYHLSRIFRQQTGLTIHNYLSQIRLRTSLDYVAQTNSTLTDLGLELGYSSHSHFTQAFRRTFNISPSAWRRSASSCHLSEMSKILTV
jgi:AraC family transcriptional regulator